MRGKLTFSEKKLYVTLSLDGVYRMTHDEETKSMLDTVSLLEENEENEDTIDSLFAEMIRASLAGLVQMSNDTFNEFIKACSDVVDESGDWN